MKARCYCYYEQISPLPSFFVAWGVGEWSRKSLISINSLETANMIYSLSDAQKPIFTFGVLDS